jgi:cyanophycinase
VIIGGAEDKEGECVILHEFLRLAGGPDANIVVMTVATRLPEEVGAQYTQVFRRLGTERVQALYIDSREDARLPTTIQVMEGATGVFFTGGNQIRVTNLLGGTHLDDCLHERQRAGMVLAGTSAGAAIMSSIMITEGSSETNPKVNVVEKSPGMGFLPDVVIDQHFAQRGRLGRLLTVVAEHPGNLGLGIDEDTAIVVQDGSFTVIGEGSVTIIDARTMTYTNLKGVVGEHNLALYGIQLHMLPAGHRFDLRHRAPVIDEPAGESE